MRGWRSDLASNDHIVLKLKTSAEENTSYFFVVVKAACQEPLIKTPRVLLNRGRTTAGTPSPWETGRKNRQRKSNNPIVNSILQ